MAVDHPGRQGGSQGRLAVFLLEQQEGLPNPRQLDRAGLDLILAEEVDPRHQVGEGGMPARLVVEHRQQISGHLGYLYYDTAMTLEGPPCKAG